MRKTGLYLASFVATVLLVLLLALATAGVRASPGILYVSTDPTCAGHSPCYTNVQDALDAATTDDEIRVATGTYTDPAGTVAEITETITLQGGWNADFIARDPDVYPTTLDAQGNGRVVQITGNISPTIDGFVITGGNANGEPVGSGLGGGIYVQSATAVISGNTITSNVADTEGGGIFVDWNVPATIFSNTIAYNQVISTTAGRGGGVRTIGDTAIVTVSHNEVYSNSLVSGFGGVIDICSPAVIDSNYVHHNQGDGILVADSPLPVTVTNNVIVGNYGRGIVGINFSDVRIVNNTIYHNSALGVDVFAWPTTPTIPITATILNNIVVSHEDDCGINAWNGVTLVADYNDSYGNQWDYCGLAYPPSGTHNISADPLFVDPANDDYHLQAGSPCIDAGTDAGVTTDIDGDPRPVGAGYDIGADEFLAHIYLPLTLKNY